MKKIVIVDRKLDDHGTRPERIKACLAQLGVEVTIFPQVYGSPSRENVENFDDDLRRLTCQTIGNKDLILLHCGDNQHFVPRVLWPDMALNLPCLLYTGLSTIPLRVSTFLATKEASPKYVAVPPRLATNLDMDWPQSPDAPRIKRCVGLLLSGTEPADALRIAFGDPRLDEILDDLYTRLSGVSVGAKPGELKDLFEAITKERDQRLEVVY